MNIKKLLKAVIPTAAALLLILIGYFFGINTDGPQNEAPAAAGEITLTDEGANEALPDAPSEQQLAEDGSYTSKEDVSLYLHLYGKLPQNYIKKNEARDLGWDSRKGNLGDVAPGKSIGGDRYGNYEGHLPENDYRECDIDYDGGRRNAKRLVFSDDGDIYYTEDHYNTFEQLYGEEG